MDKKVKIPILLDIYGSLLSETQYYYVDAYYNFDLSLSEIADNVGKTRQGICESIKRAESFLFETENKLHFLEKNDLLKKDLISLEKAAKDLENTMVKCGVTYPKEKLKYIFDILNKYIHD